MDPNNDEGGGLESFQEKLKRLNSFRSIYSPWQKPEVNTSASSVTAKDLNALKDELIQEIGKLKIENEEATKKVNQIDAKINNRTKKASKDSENKFKEIIEKTNSDTKKEFIGIFGIFAALLTFVSVEFKVLQSEISFAKASGLTILLSAVMLMFISSMKFLFVDKYEGWDFLKKNWGIILVILTLFFIAGCFFWYEIYKEIFWIKR